MNLESSNLFTETALQSLDNLTNSNKTKEIKQFTSSTQLKAHCKNKAKEKNTSAQIILQNYMLENLIEKISLSKYKDNFIIKGGFLIAYKIGVENRNTMDLDMTLKNLQLDANKLSSIFNDIFLIDIGNDIKFNIIRAEAVMEEMEYPGICMHIEATFENMKIPLGIDIATGSVITPNEIITKFKKMFSNDEINIKSYTMETVIAEKYETFISRSITNTRMKDYYDIYTLTKLNLLDAKILNDAIYNTFKSRDGLDKLNLEHIKKVVVAINDSDYIGKLWAKYQKDYSYARDITLNDVLTSIYTITSYINFKG